jgi:hypothetical protein
LWPTEGLRLPVLQGPQGGLECRHVHAKKDSKIGAALITREHMGSEAPETLRLSDVPAV